MVSYISLPSWLLRQVIPLSTNTKFACQKISNVHVCTNIIINYVLMKYITFFITFFLMQKAYN